MGIVRKLNPLYEGIVRAWEAKGLGSHNSVSRLFRRNLGTTDHAQFAAPITLAGDFDLEIDVLATGLEQTILGASSATDLRVHFHITSTGELSLYSNTHGTVRVSTFTIPLNVLTKVGFSRQGDVLKLKNISSGQEDLFNGFAGDVMEFDYLYNYYVAANIWGGILANLKIWDNGTLTHWLPIDDAGDILANRATTLGDNIWTDSVTVGTISENVIVTVGATYLIETENPDITVTVLGGNPNFAIGETGGSHIFTPTSSPIAITSGGASTAGTTISLRRADGYGTVVNGNDDDSQVYTQQSTGEWLGQELVANGGFDNGVDNWVSFDPDGAIHGEDGYCVVTPVNMVNSARGAEQLIPTTIGSTIRLSGFIDATEWGAGSPHIQKRDPSVTMSGVLSGTSGISSGEFVATATSSKIWLRCDGPPTNLTWRVLHDNVSAREVLNVA